MTQAEADARERHWQSQVSGLQSKVEKLEGLLQREMGHHQITSPTPRPLYDISPVGPGQQRCRLSGCLSICLSIYQHRSAEVHTVCRHKVKALAYSITGCIAQQFKRVPDDVIACLSNCISIAATTETQVCS